MKFQINVAENAGFCFGVDRAVKIVYNILNRNEKAVTKAASFRYNCGGFV